MYSELPAKPFKFLKQLKKIQIPKFFLKRIRIMTQYTLHFFSALDQGHFPVKKLSREYGTES